MEEGGPSRDRAKGREVIELERAAAAAVLLPSKKAMEEVGTSSDRRKEREVRELERTAAAAAWVIIPAIPRVIDDERHRLMPGTDLSLQLAEPPRATMLSVARHLHTDFGRHSCVPYVIDVLPSGSFLLFTSHGYGASTIYQICDAHSRVATPLTPSSIAPIYPLARRSVGFIDDPDHRGHHLVAQLHPTSTTLHKTLVYYSTFTGQWGIKRLHSSPPHQLWGTHGGVLAYDGKLWWADLRYGLLMLDPFADKLDLRHVALPEGCVVMFNSLSFEELYRYRLIKTSEGKLRYVQIHGLPAEPMVSMWTLVDPEESLWEREYEVHLHDIWSDHTFNEAGLAPGKVPAIALIDPKNHGVLYFLQGNLIFSVDMCASSDRVLHCDKFLLGNGEAWEKYRTSQFVHAWELPPTLHRADPLSGVLSMRMINTTTDVLGTAEIQLTPLYNEWRGDDGQYLLWFCTSCEEFIRFPEDHDHQDKMLKLMRLYGRWTRWVSRSDKWAHLFEGIDDFLPPVEPFGRLFALFPPPGLRCSVCNDKSGNGTFCTLRCRVMSPDAEEAPHWAKALLLVDFSKACIADRVCHCFPSKAFCTECCGFHHQQLHRVNGADSTVTVKGEGALKSRNGRVLVRHELRGTRCVGLCAVCSKEVPEKEYNRHKCFMDYQITTVKKMTREDFAHEPKVDSKPDMFCVDCVSSFSSVHCVHHTGHRILEFITHKKAAPYKFNNIVLISALRLI
uniref:DUF1618 domain-containing protein n=1 Tax=Oryza glumipatula TaxID=40148 RepID=A0A0D9Y4B2_9ORYZ